MPSITTENYLKAVYQLREKHPEADLVKFGDVAKELDVTPGTVTTMMKSLADRGLLEYHLRTGVKLTQRGHHMATGVVRRHRLIELFLVQVLKMDWAEVHEDAEALEHAVSDKVLDRINAMMGHPKMDPHGDPIPGNIPDSSPAEYLYLHQTTAGTLYEVSRIDDQNPMNLETVANLGLKPGALFHRVTSSLTSADTVTLKVGSDDVDVPLALAANIQVKVTP